MNLLDLVLGRRLANREKEGRKLGWFEAVPAMGLDGLSSASYGPEAALAILIPLGAAGVRWIGWVMAPVVLLLGLLYLSYRQTVAAYQTNGGAYAVSKENLGRTASLLAASALMIDYVLNVAVGISAGVGALISSLPVLQPHTLALCLAILALVTLANLRGTSEAGWLFALPTYVFMVSFLGLLGVGLVRCLTSGGAPAPVIPPPRAGGASEAASLWLLMRAFAAGCTAMTGVEAVSNGVSAFKAPVRREAHRTLTVICLTLALLLSGVAVLASAFQIQAMDQTRPGYQSVLSQLAGAVYGRGPAYGVAMVSLLAVLSLSANTSFVGFPRLSRLVAEDGFLPRPFALADRRLVFSVGVGFLTVTAGGLLIAFQGVTDRLIPLFAVGAFLTFTLSQAGMVVHWRRRPGRNLLPLAINGVGALATLLAFGVILAAKFLEGAWLVVVAIPATMGLMTAIRRYYDRIDGALAPEAFFHVAETAPPTVLVAFEARSVMADEALRFALTLSPDVIAIHLMNLDGPDAEEDARELRRRWDAEVASALEGSGTGVPRLVLLPAPKRQIHAPLLDFIERLDAATPGRSVAVLIPEMVLTRWWEGLLHARRAERLRAELLKHGGPRLKVVTCPWRPDPPAGARA